MYEFVKNFRETVPGLTIFFTGYVLLVVAIVIFGLGEVFLRGHNIFGPYQNVVSAIMVHIVLILITAITCGLMLPGIMWAYIPNILPNIKQMIFQFIVYDILRTKSQ